MMSDKDDSEARKNAQNQASAVMSIYLLSEMLGLTMDDAASIYLKAMSAFTKALDSKVKEH